MNRAIPSRSVFWSCTRSSAAATRNIWLASWYLANGLEFQHATASRGRMFRATFVFNDPDARAAGLETEFHAHRAVQGLISARKALSEILEEVHMRGWCEPADVAESLRALPQAGGPDA